MLQTDGGTRGEPAVQTRGRRLRRTPGLFGSFRGGVSQHVCPLGEVFLMLGGHNSVCPVTMWDLLILVGTEDESNLEIKDEDSVQGKVRLGLRERVQKWLEVNVL